MRSPTTGRPRPSAIASVLVAMGVVASACKNDVAAPTYSVSGVVTLRRSPVQGASVWADADGFRSYTTVTSADGAYTISGLPSGTMTVHARDRFGDYAATAAVTVPPSVAGLDLVLVIDD